MGISIMNHYSGVELPIYTPVQFITQIVFCMTSSQGKFLRDAVWNIILEVCPLGTYFKYQWYRWIGIDISLIVNIIYQDPICQDYYMRQLPFLGHPYSNFQPLYMLRGNSYPWMVRHLKFHQILSHRWYLYLSTLEHTS